MSNHEHYDLCIIGSGSGSAVIDSSMDGWKIALIDKGTGIRESFGGTCLNAGCIPTKMFVVPSDFALTPLEARDVNTSVTFNGIDFPALQKRILNRIDKYADKGLSSTERRENITVIRGAARFVDEHTLAIGNRRITADRFVIAAGSRPRTLRAPGFNEPDLQAFIHTSESIMRIDRLPKRLTIVGGGVEAIEFGHIFAAMGTKVSIIARGEALIRHHDVDISERISELMSDRVTLRFHQSVTGLEAAPDGGVIVVAEDTHGMEYTYASDAVLLCLGRVPNGDQLRLERAGLELDDKGFVPVDEHMRTSVRHIWALGDVCSPQMLKHLANRQAKVVKHNLLAERDGSMPTEMTRNPVPFGIFGAPEIAGVGATQAQLDESGADYVSHIHLYGQVAYGWAMGDPDEFFVKVLAEKGTGKLLGAHIIGPQATSLIQPFTMAMCFGIPLPDLARDQYWIHPALIEVVENAALQAAAKAGV